LVGLLRCRPGGPGGPRDAASRVRAYKSLATVERAFRSLQTVDLYVRPSGHRLTERVRAHVLLCMVAYDVEWHMRQALAPLLLDDDDKARAEAQRSAVVAPAQRSPPGPGVRRRPSRPMTGARCIVFKPSCATWGRSPRIRFVSATARWRPPRCARRRRCYNSVPWTYCRYHSDCRQEPTLKIACSPL